MTLSSDARLNRAAWTKYNAEYTDVQAAAAWAQDEIEWGVFATPETELHVLDDVEGKDVVELGCGTAYFSAWLAKRGARPVGVDVTPAQLATARRMQQETGIDFPLIEASAEQVPLPDASFDLVLSEYGASIWADPRRWVPEAARLLRPGGVLVFMCNSTLSILCSPDVGKVDDRLHRAQLEVQRIDWRGEGTGVNYYLGHGEWIELLRANGFDVECLWELRAPDGARDHDYYDFVSAEWARRWPAEEVWKARKRG